MDKINGPSDLNFPKIRAKVLIPLKDGLNSYFFTFNGLSHPGEHLAIDFRESDQLGSRVPVRIHSECLTGDVFGSSRCDCGGQLQEAIEYLSQNHGVLIYLRQEGRGIGLYNKLDAYLKQDKGLNTFQANLEIGFGEDLRCYKVASEILNCLGISSIQLHSNSPDKESQLRYYGIKVLSRVPTGTFLNPHNEKYLKSKKEFSRHSFAGI